LVALLSPAYSIKGYTVDNVDLTERIEFIGLEVTLRTDYVVSMEIWSEFHISKRVGHTCGKPTLLPSTRDGISLNVPTQDPHIRLTEICIFACATIYILVTRGFRLESAFVLISGVISFSGWYIRATVPQHQYHGRFNTVYTAENTPHECWRSA
jgi:hypothetical protein